MIADRWFYRPGIRQDVRGRLICFPYAGGSPTMYANWATRLPPGVELIAVRLPGRDMRFREPAVSDWPTLLASLQPALAPLLDMPFALFGHSLGASIAYELAARLDDQSKVRFAHLIVSGRHPPCSPQPRPPMHDLPRQAFLTRLRELNGIPPEILANEPLMQLLEPTLRADIKLAETWKPADEQSLRVAVTALAGASDDIAPPALVLGWKRHTTSTFTFHIFAGDHFFIHSAAMEIIDSLVGIWPDVGG